MQKQSKIIFFNKQPCFICGKPSVTGMSSSKGFSCYSCEEHRKECYENCIAKCGKSVHDWIKKYVLETIWSEEYEMCSM